MNCAVGTNINGPPFRSAGVAGIGLCARGCHPRARGGNRITPGPPGVPGHAPPGSVMDIK
jgi:hypothetical protein